MNDYLLESTICHDQLYEPLRGNKPTFRLVLPHCPTPRLCTAVLLKIITRHLRVSTFHIHSFGVCVDVPAAKGVKR